ncbi:PepSY domain-containing protein [Luteimonas fraxinea]|uniref:PepSY domain-containing protein n=1 Tax=Luteimonas fraxinea TaxID=2901869 RepID=A0ABS8UHD4_9GAMM|nr:PepSY domain-containing protein [Luteimonas fraxinea]MCD9098330.1 PepSY domain-containing protein [Luteimonas fraxinea]UHH08736.1 PepSY domain-containing protein [Luteimonas fraxinea]
MQHTTAIRGLVLALSLAAGAAVAQDAMTSTQVRAALTEGGYTNIHDVEFKDGVWKADVTDANGTKIDVRLDPATGRVYPETAGATSLGESDIRAKLTAEGFTRIEDVKFDDGMWEAEADNAQGQRMDLKLDPEDGRIVSQSRD